MPPIPRYRGYFPRKRGKAMVYKRRGRRVSAERGHIMRRGSAKARTGIYNAEVGRASLLVRVDGGPRVRVGVGVCVAQNI